jgi:hypothetical protein
LKSMRSLYKKLFHYVPDKRILAYFSMALSAAAVCSYMGAYWFLWQSIVSILVIPVYEKAMYGADRGIGYWAIPPAGGAFSCGDRPYWDRLDLPASPGPGISID